MKKETRLQIENYLQTLSANSMIDIVGLVDIDNIDINNAYESIYEMIEDNGGFNIDVIYYSNAIKYLAENDCSLNDCLALADECGYELKNLNSEVLASLLASHIERNNFSDMETEINDFFDVLDQDEEN